MEKISIVDSHTGGEPTRVVLSGFPTLRATDMAGRLAELRNEHDRYRSATVGEPRSAEEVVGALLTAPVEADSVAGVIFFNNAGYLGMCGHGSIGLIATLAYLGRILAGVHRVDTPVGTIVCELHADGSVSIENVASWRKQKDVAVEVPGYGTVVGDIAWGGNWFYLIKNYPGAVGAAALNELSAYASAVRKALDDAGITGEDGAEVDHVEICAASPTAGCDGRNFVLCPGHAYDRSPCGTGTSAKLACLAADGDLKPGDNWRQESVIGSFFDARFRWAGDDRARIVPTITGRAHISGEGQLLLDPADPFCWGLR